MECKWAQKHTQRLFKYKQIHQHAAMFVYVQLREEAWVLETNTNTQIQTAAAWKLFREISSSSALPHTLPHLCTVSFQADGGKACVGVHVKLQTPSLLSDQIKCDLIKSRLTLPGSAAVVQSQSPVCRSWSRRWPHLPWSGNVSSGNSQSECPSCPDRLHHTDRQGG